MQSRRKRAESQVLDVEIANQDDIFEPTGNSRAENRGKYRSKKRQEPRQLDDGRPPCDGRRNGRMIDESLVEPRRRSG
jgi:hypothetical protein